MIPGIDCAGIVEESEVPELRRGDQVIQTGRRVTDEDTSEPLKGVLEGVFHSRGSAIAALRVDSSGVLLRDNNRF
jgi:NADPH:quinone reductase-like Zn-dependent oxidoreductase